MPNFIEDDGILLPEFLFYFDDSKSLVLKNPLLKLTTPNSINL